MAAPSTTMLFLPPNPPMCLSAKACVILGRSRTCDLTLSGADASRRHAEILGTGHGFVLRDLDSTNGTFVNGERIDKRVLRRGDRIEIGDSTITFCVVQADLAQPLGSEEAPTVVTERPVPGKSEALRGGLDEIPPDALLQILELGRKTGVLKIESESGGQIWLRDGAPIHAETRCQIGFDAALTLVQAKTGRFIFESRSDCPESTIRASITQLLLESSRRMDEARG